MKHIVILSDTHGLLRPEVLEYLTQADIIIHGGDINTQAIVDKLREYAPLHIVRGNNDKDWAKGLPHSLTFDIEILLVLVLDFDGFPSFRLSSTSQGKTALFRHVWVSLFDNLRVEQEHIAESSGRYRIV